jgi:hypothetical protein
MDRISHDRRLTALWESRIQIDRATHLQNAAAEISVQSRDLRRKAEEARRKAETIRKRSKSFQPSS